MIIIRLLFHLIACISFIACQQTNITDEINTNPDYSQIFLRKYFIGYWAYGLYSFQENQIQLSQQNQILTSNTQEYDLFWNDHGLQGDSAFGLFQLDNHGIFTIRVFTTDNYNSFQETEFQMQQVLSILQSAVFNDDIFIFAVKTTSSNTIFVQLLKDQYQDYYPLTLEISQQIEYIYGNFYSINTCVYKISSQGDYYPKELVSSLIICMSDYNDIVVEIQYVGDSNLIISGQIYQLRFYDNILTYLQPLTSLVIVNSNNKEGIIIQDLNSFDPSISNFVFNSAFTLSYSTSLMLLGKTNKSHNQQYQSLMLFSYSNGASLTSYLQETDYIKIYGFLVNYNYYLYTFMINYDSGILNYDKFDLNGLYKYVLSSKVSFKLLVYFWVILLLMGFFGGFYNFLLIRRKKMSQILQKQLEVYLFEVKQEMTRELFVLKYDILPDQPLGSGGFGDVFKATNLHKKIVKNVNILDKMPDYFACKRIFLAQGELAKTNTDQQAVWNEISILKRLQRFKNVIPMYNYCWDDKEAIIGFKLADRNLSAVILENRSKNEYFSENTILLFLQQIGNTIAKIFLEENIAHRDLKPDNILCAGNDFFISDFGCAKEINLREIQKNNNLILGTMKWMSPEMRDAYFSENITEQKENIKIDYFKSDVFSLGLVLLHMLLLADIAQVNADEQNKQQKLKIVANNRQDLNPNVLILLEKMLETNPTKRPDASVLHKTIEELCIQIE